MHPFTPAQIDRARAVLENPGPALSPAHLALQQRIARHVLDTATGARDRKVIHVSRAVFQAGPHIQKLTRIDGGRQ